MPRSQRIFQSEGHAPRQRIREHAGDDPRSRRIEYRRRRRSERPLELERRPLSAIGNGAIGIGQLPEADFRRAQGQGKTIEIAIVHYIVESQHLQALDERIRTHQHQGAHGRHVQRRRQGCARADQSFEIAIVVLRYVESTGGDQVHRGIIDQRSRGDQLALDCHFVEEGLQRRSGLAGRAHAVDVDRARRTTSVADIGQYLAAAIVDHEDGGVGDMVVGECGQLLPQQVCCENLQPGIECRLHTRMIRRKQRPRDVGRQRGSRRDGRYGRQRRQRQHPQLLRNARRVSYFQRACRPFSPPLPVWHSVHATARRAAATPVRRGRSGPCRTGPGRPHPRPAVRRGKSRG